MNNRVRFADAVFLSWRGIVLCCAVLLALLGANALIFYRNTQTLLAEEHAVAHTQEVLAGLNGTLATITDAESAQRGYILIGSATYLQRYAGAARATGPRIAHVQRLVADNPPQKQRAILLSALATAKLADLAQTIALRRSGQSSQAQALVLTVRSQTTTDAIRAVLDTMTATELALLHRRTAAASNAASTTTATLVAATAVDAILLAAILLTIQRTLVRRTQLADERARLLLRAERARAEAVTAVGIRDEFLSLAAHELKTPLTSVLANTQLLQRHGDALSARDQRLVTSILRGTDRLCVLTEHLLDLSLLEQGVLDLDLDALDLVALAQRSAAEVQATTSRHTLRVTAVDAPIIVRADRLRLEQVVHDLLANAVKYSPNGGEVVVTVTCADDCARLAVRDRGVGIPKDALAHIFDRYYRAPNVVSHNYTGLGMGLYMAQEIVTRHGGAITVESAEGQGSAFTIELPLALDRRPTPPL